MTAGTPVHYRTMLWGFFKAWALRDTRAKPELRGVYFPWRLKVLRIGQSFSGRVTAVRAEADGDVHTLIIPSDRALLGPGQDQLVVEFMPGQKEDVKVGDAIEGEGTWVFDTWHGWNEIHPVFKLNGKDILPSEYSHFTLWKWALTMIETHRRINRELD